MDMRNTTTRGTNALLWTGQALLAALFTLTGIAKLAMPAEVLAAQSGLPGTFLHFIAVCELLGAAGLILPSALRVKPFLTPLAAAGLTIIMVGAVVTSAATLGVSAAVMPFIVGMACAAVAQARWPLTATKPAGSDGIYLSSDGSTPSAAAR
jgi:uncharacterized membrane protein YphA (DoxX/SURF4 family)